MAYINSNTYIYVHMYTVYMVDTFCSLVIYEK